MLPLAGPGCWLLCLLPALLGEAKPLPCLQSPTKVSCRAAGLHSFPEELPQGVTHLELSHNLIQNLSGSRLPALGQLELLDLRFNLLEAVRGPALPQLRQLLLGSNRLHRQHRANAAAVGRLRGLEVLDLSANGLESHMAEQFLGGLASLRALDLAGNRLSRLPAGIFRGCPRLSELDLSDNVIMEIEEGAFEALGQLAVLNLALNSLHCLSGFSLRQLRVLNLSHNALELFGWEEAGGPYLLRVLDLSHNRLLQVPQLPGARGLTHLNLSHNAIAALDPGSHRPAPFVLPYVEMAQFNASQGTAAGLAWLAELDLSHNSLSLLPMAFLRALRSLHTLSVAMNCLQDITREPLPGDGDGNGAGVISLRSLDLHGNAIRALPPWFFDLLPQLEAIDLGSNSLQPCQGDPGPSGGGPQWAEPCTAFYNVPHLKHLSLRGNGLTQLPPSAFGQTPLLSLELSENRGLAVPRAALAGLERSLQRLSLRGNQMADSGAGLPCLGALRALDLSGNRLSVLPRGALCSPLEALDVRDNALRALPGWPRGLRVLWLSGNPFGCCGLGWLRALRAAGVRLPDLHRARCSHPGNGTAPLGGRPPWPCPRPHSPGVVVVAVVAVVVMVAMLGVPLCLGCRASCLRGCRAGVLPPPPQTQRAAEAAAADRDTKV